MRVHVLGGGPSGLYLSILVAKRDPSAKVVVTERNASGETFGWGVVFSDETDRKSTRLNSSHRH